MYFYRRPTDFRPRLDLATSVPRRTFHTNIYPTLTLFHSKLLGKVYKNINIFIKHKVLLNFAHLSIFMYAIGIKKLAVRS